MTQAQKEIDQSQDFLGVGTACACVCAKHRREQCRGSSFSMLKHGEAVLKHGKTAAEALLPSVLSTHTGACTTPKKSSDCSLSFCACLIVFVSNARMNNVLFLFNSLGLSGLAIGTWKMQPGGFPSLEQLGFYLFFKTTYLRG